MRTSVVVLCLALPACGSVVTVVGATGGAGGAHASATGAGGSGAGPAVASAETATATVTAAETATASATADATSAAASTGSGSNCGAEHEQLCAGECVDTWTDASHCGGCFEICGSGQYCAGGSCAPFKCVDLIEAEDASKVQRSDGWSVAYGNVVHGGAELESWTQVSNASLELPFVGVGVVVYYARGGNGGDFTVAIDGGTPALVHGHIEPDFQYQVPFVATTGLTPGPHTLALRCKPGTGYCRVDYFAVVQPCP